MPYQYEPWVYEEIQRCVRGLFEPGIPLKRATLVEDLGGVDIHYIVNHHTSLQVRCRFDRPHYAADSDITFRTTEPAMMAAGTYAPLALFCWFTSHHIEVARLFDMRRLFTRINPPFSMRPIVNNRDGRTGFYVVEMKEVWEHGVMLRSYDGRTWSTPILGGAQRLNRILREPRSEPVL